MAIDFKAWEENLQEFKEKEVVKTVIVTGASGGIGSATAKKFYDNGYKVAMLDIKEEALQAVAEKYEFDPERIMICEINITDEE
ncbi:MAG: SDR family NAD(P)-dependent oxidoreductase, partial [Firmicutes bacterium]|nr:SDR family NAD(P)-dependent oxidoreductase [Bacillota bacterium]